MSDARRIRSGGEFDEMENAQGGFILPAIGSIPGVESGSEDVEVDEEESMDLEDTEEFDIDEAMNIDIDDDDI